MNQQDFPLKNIMIATTLLVSAIISLADTADIFGHLNLKAYDAQFYIKTRISAHDPVAPVVLVEIDDKTFEDKQFKIPLVLWHNYYSKVIRGLADSDAKVIALDYLLPQELYDNIVPDYSRTWLKAFAYAKSKGTRVVTGYIEMQGRQIVPQSRFLQIIGRENLALFNLTADDDDFVRRQRLIFQTEKGDKTVNSFSCLIVRAFQPGFSPPSDTVYIDYLNPGNFFPRYSFSDISQKITDNEISFLKQALEGKIVIIGSTDSLTHDRHSTPLYYIDKRENKRTPGVEIIANEVSTLLGKHFFSEIPVHSRFGIYLALAFPIIFFTFGEYHRYIFVFLPGLILAYGAVCIISFINYLILPLVPGIAAIILGQAVSLYYRYAVIDKEKRRIRSVFQRYLHSEVVSQLLASNDTDFLKGKKMRLCILFSDIRSFTKYSETRSPEEVVSRLNEYFEAMSEAVFSEGGIVDKFLGDGLMAFFGVFDDPGKPAGPSLSGVRAAINMLDRLEKLNQNWQKQGQETFRIGVGIHTGEVKVGNIGSHNKMEYTIIGDAVNLTSRLQDKTKALKETILVSEAVYNDLTDAIEAEDKGIEEIRGRSPIRIYALKGIR